MSRIIVFAVALEILTLGSPLLNQLVIDEVLVAADQSLLTVIIIALLLMSLTQMLLSLAASGRVLHCPSILTCSGQHGFSIIWSSSSGLV